MARFWFVYSILTLGFVTLASAAPATFSYQGQIIKPDSQPLEASSVTFLIEILSPNAESCLLFQESHTINMAGSNGLFSLEVGNGTRTGTDYEDVTPLATALSNSTGLVTPTTCDSVGTYNPASSDGRKLRITFDDGTGPTTLAQDHNIVSVPYATNASSIDGLSVADLVRINNSGGVVLTQSNLESVFGSAAMVTELLDLINGNSTQYSEGTPSGPVSMNSQRVTNVATPTGANDAANKDYADDNVGGRALDTTTVDALGAGDSGEVLTWSGTQWTSSAPSGDSTKLPLAGGTMTGGIAMGNQDITDIKDVDVNNNLDVGNNLTVANDVSITGGIGVGTGINSNGTITVENQNTIRFGDADSTALVDIDYVGFRAPASITAPGTIWTLPATDGTAGQILSTDGSGVLSWVSDSAPVDSVFGRTGTVVAATSDYDAIQVDNTAAGNIIATNVQAAINELDTEKVAKSGDQMTGALQLNATNEVRFADADSSNYVGFASPAIVGSNQIWVLPNADGNSGEYLQTDGSGQLTFAPAPTAPVTSVHGRTGVVVAATSDYDAIQIDNTAAGTITATNVQAAIDELDTEKVATTRTISTAANSGLTGGGDLSANRSLSLDIPGTTDLGAPAVGADSLLIYDASGTAIREVTRTQLVLSESEVDTFVGNNGYAADADKVNRAGDTMTGDLNLDNEQEIRFSEADGSGANYVGFKAPTTLAADQIWTLPIADGTTGQVLQTNGSGVLTWVTQNPGVTDHGALTGLTDDDHGQYALLAGRSSGQALIGGTDAGDDLTLESTSNATKGDVLLQPNGGNVGIGTTSTGRKLSVRDTTGNVFTSVVSANTDDAGILLGDTDADTRGQIRYLNSSDSMALYTASGERLRVDSTGNVGIGTTIPGHSLDVHVTDNTAYVAGNLASWAGTSRFYNNSTTPGAVAGINIRNRASDWLLGTVQQADTSSDFVIATDDGIDGEVLRIDGGTGNVGIGSASPTARLDVAGKVQATAFGGDGSDLTGVAASSSAGGTTPSNYVINTDSDNAGSDGGVTFQTNSSTVATITASGEIRGASGSAGTPALSFTGDTNTGIFNPAADTLSMAAGGTEILRLNGGNVGIGTTTPLSILHVAQTDAASLMFLDGHLNSQSAPGLAGRKARGTTAVPTAVLAEDYLFNIGARGYGATGFSSTSKALLSIKAEENWTDTQQGTLIAFETTEIGGTTRTEKMRINSAGNVGIGTTAPNGKLDVLDKVAGNEGKLTSTSYGLTSTRFTNSTAPTYLNLYKARGTEAARTIVQNGDSMGRLQFGAWDGDNYELAAQINSAVKNVAADGDVAGNITFETRPDGDTEPRVRMVIDENGRVGIGSATPTSTLDVAGTVTATAFAGDGSGLTGVAASSSGSGTTASNYVINTDSDNAGGDGGVTFQTNSGTVATITASGEIRGASGSAGTPALSFTGDTNTGIFNPAADTLSIAAGGTEALRLKTIASGVNYVEVTPATTGNDPTIAAGGSDTNIDLSITPKGTGNTVFTSGNVGIGTADPNHKLTVEETITDTDKRGVQVVLESHAATTGPYAHYGGVFKAKSTVGTGVTNSGSNTGIWATSMRNNTTGSDDDGTLSLLRGGVIQYGHQDVEVAETPITTDVYGLFLHPYFKTGSISTMYDLYIDEGTTGGSVVKHYGLYVGGAGKDNYIQGRVGIGSTDPNYNLQVDGTLYGVAGAFESNLQVSNPSILNRAYGFLSTDDNSTIFGGNLRLDPGQTGGTHDGYLKGTNERAGGALLVENQNGGSATFRFLNSDDTDDDNYTVSEVMTILGANGRVGIGTTSPSTKLEAMAGQIRSTRSIGVANQYVEIDGGDAGGTYITGHSSESNKKRLEFRSVHNSSTGASGTNGFAFQIGPSSGPTEVMSIAESGNVGIGTTIPGSKLEVNSGNNEKGLKVGDSGLGRFVSLGYRNQTSVFSTSASATGFIQGESNVDKIVVGENLGVSASNAGLPGFIVEGAATPTADYVQVRSNGATGGNLFAIDSAGNVGIGTTGPASRLHLNAAGAGGGLCVTSDGVCGSVPAGGQISAETTLNTGADYAEYFEAEESLSPGDLVGLNSVSGKARGYRAGDQLLGIVSTAPGVIGNSDLANNADTVLVALVGQVPFKRDQVIEKQGKIFTLDRKPLGYLLASGNVYINLNSNSADGEQNRSISSIKKQLQNKDNEIMQLKERLQRLENLFKEATRK